MTDLLDLFEVPQRYCSEAAEEALLRIDERLLRVSADWNGSNGLLLLGPSGCGKSLAAATAMRRLTLGKSRHWAAWVRADTVSRICAARDKADDLARIKSVYLLTLDELGYERFPELVLELLGERYNRDLPTLVTSGKSPVELKDRYGTALLRRITEVGNGCVVDCWGDKPIPVAFGAVPKRVVSLQSGAAWGGMKPVDMRDIGLP